MSARKISIGGEGRERGLGVIVVLDRIWKSRKWKEKCIHIQMETSPHVPTQFSIMEGMHIYVCSKEKWTGPPNSFVSLTITYVVSFSPSSHNNDLVTLKCMQKWGVLLFNLIMSMNLKVCI